MVDLQVWSVASLFMQSSAKPLSDGSFEQEGEEVGESVKMTIEANVSITQFYAVTYVCVFSIISCSSAIKITKFQGFLGRKSQNSEVIQLEYHKIPRFCLLQKAEIWGNTGKKGG